MCFLAVSYFRVEFFFFKQQTAYELRISDWSSDVCSSDLRYSGRCDRSHGRTPRAARPTGAGRVLLLASTRVPGWRPLRDAVRARPLLRRRDEADRKSVV